MPRNKRVQVSDLNAYEPLRPTPIQSDTFTGAPRAPDVSANYDALARSLGSFSRSLFNLDNELHRPNPKKDKRNDTILANKLAKLTVEERAQVARTGILPDGTVISHKPALMKAAGQADGIILNQKLSHELANNFDWEHQDADAWLAQKQQEYLQSSGIRDPFAIKGFLEKSNQLRSKALTQQHTFQEKRALEYEGDVVYKNLEGLVYEKIEEGLQPDEIHRFVRAAYKDFGKKGTIGMNYEQLDKYVLAIADNIATTHPKVALELINGKREGAGPASAPISSKVALKARAEQITATAKKAIINMEADATEQRLYQDNARRVMEGDYSSFKEVVIPEADGSPRKITIDDQEKSLTNALMKWGEQAQKEDKLTPAAVDRNVVPIMQRMNLDNPYLINEIDGLEKRVSGNTLGDQNSTNDIIERFNRWRDMKAIAPSYVRSQLSEPTQKFLNTMDNLVRYKHMDTRRAILMANKAYTNLEENPALAQSMSYYRDQIKTAVGDYLDTYWLTNSTNDPTYNIGIATAETEDYARTLYATGEYTPEEAIEQAAKEIAKSQKVYKGRIVSGLEKFSLAPNWQEGADAIVEKFKEQGLSINEDYFLTHIGGGQLYLSDRNGNPLTNKNGYPMATTVGEINQMAYKIANEPGEEAIEETVERSKDSFYRSPEADKIRERMSRSRR